MISVVTIALAIGLGTSSFVCAGDAGATPRLGTASVGQFATSSALTGSKPSSTRAAVTNDLAYDLAEANGRVVAVGKAAYYGSAFGKHLVAPIIELVSTPDRKGYWLIGADGSVYPFGDARRRVVPGASCGGTRSWPPQRRLTVAGTGLSLRAAR